jgi:hypothetical protein
MAWCLVKHRDNLTFTIPHHGPRLFSFLLFVSKIQVPKGQVSDDAIAKGTNQTSPAQLKTQISTGAISNDRGYIRGGQHETAAK